MASRIVVRLVFEDQKLLVEIEDDGCGFDVSAAPAFEDGHFGLTGMRERAASMKADLTILSGSHGTRVSLVVPIPRRRPFWRSVPPWTHRLGSPLRSWLSR
jgi:signal transduction histidine kinase